MRFYVERLGDGEGELLLFRIRYRGRIIAEGLRHTRAECFAALRAYLAPADEYLRARRAARATGAA